MARIIDRLAPFFYKKKDSELNPEIYAITNAMDRSLELLSEDVKKFIYECYLSTSTREWLDTWGEWFGIPRKSGEIDPDYRDRIIYIVLRPTTTISSILQLIYQQMDRDDIKVSIYEPFNNLKTFNKSKFSGSDRYRNQDYWRHSVIDIVSNIKIPADVQKQIELIKGAGIKVHYTTDLCIGGDNVVSMLPTEEAYFENCVYLDSVIRPIMYGGTFSGGTPNRKLSGDLTNMLTSEVFERYWQIRSGNYTSGGMTSGDIIWESQV